MKKINRTLPDLSQGPAIQINGQALPKREDIPEQYKWKLTDIYASGKDFDEDVRQCRKLIAKMPQYKNTLNSPEKLLRCLSLQDAINQKTGRLFAYARMSRDTDAGNSHYQAITAQIESLLADAAGKSAFIEPEILALPAKYLKSAIEAIPALKIYEFYLADLTRQKQHVLPPAEEELLAKASEILGAPANIYTMLTNADMTFPQTPDDQGGQIQLSEGRYAALIRSGNRGVRRAAFENLFCEYGKFRNTFAASFSGNVKSKIFQAKARNYSSTLDAALSGANIPVQLYKNLIATIHQNLKPLHQYIDLKKEILRLNEIHMYDLYVPLTQEPAASYPYEDGLRLVLDSLQPLGSKYCEDLAAGIRQGWIDIYETPGKRTGAYSWGVYGVHPFILLNYDGQYGSVSTLAHELGHAMHSYYSNKSQPYVNASYTIFCAEVASTANELLLLEHMLQIENDPKRRIYFINQYLEQVRTTVYRQTMFAEFELMAHQKAEAGEALTADLLDEFWLELNRKYYGDNIILDDGIKNEWARIPHFYRSFYVYQYATGYCAAAAIASSLKKNGAQARQRYLAYLKSGGGGYSIELLKKAGADMGTPLPIESTLHNFGQKLAELKKSLGNT